MSQPASPAQQPEQPQQPQQGLAAAFGARLEQSSIDSSRGYLTTLLGEFVLPAGGEVWTQTLIEAMGLLGFNADAARQAVARTHGRGWLERRSVGRQTRWTLSPLSRQVLEDGAQRIYDFAQTARLWDRRWLLVQASVPESARQVRYRMNVGLSWAGFGSLGQGTWISPWTSHEAHAVALMRDLEIDARTFIAQIGQLGDGRELVGQAWDLAALRERHDSFLASTADLDQDLTGPESVAALADLVHQWRKLPFHDPDLPRELLPAGWPGPTAANRFRQLRSQLVVPAVRWWQATEADFTPATPPAPST